MRRFRPTLWVSMLFLICPAMVWACAFPAPLRSVNTTLLAVLDNGGTVSIHQREALRRAMSQVTPDALKRTLRQDIARRDARAAGAVIDTAVALAGGRGMAVPLELREDVARLEQAVRGACTGTAVSAGGTEDAKSAEHGSDRSEGSGGRALTFREGVARLSITFTIYLAFLAFLLGARRSIKDRIRAARAAEPAQPDDAELI